MQFLELTVSGRKDELEQLLLEYDDSDSEYKRKIFLTEADASNNTNEFGFIVDYSDTITPVIGKANQATCTTSRIWIQRRFNNSF